MAGSVAYARVSTDSGEQLSALRSQLGWLKQQGCERILQDVESGLNPERSGYQQLQQLVKAGAIERVVATSASRLGRNAMEFVGFVQLCDARGVVIHSRDDGLISCASPEQLMLTFLKAALSQGESMRLSQRIRSGREAGKALKRPMKKPCWPYRLSADRMKLELVDEQVPIAEALLADLRANGWRMLPVLQRYQGQVPFGSVRALRSWLLNPTIRGALAYGQLPNHQFKEVVWDTHPALMSAEDFAQMQCRIEANRKLWGVHGSRQLRALTGLCVCSECGNRLGYIPGRAHAALRCRGDLCSQHYKGVREEVVLRWVTEELPRQASVKLAALVEQPESPELLLLRQQISKLEGLCDPDLQPAIEAKRQRLLVLEQQPPVDPELLQRIAEPGWFSVATYEELTTVLHRSLSCIQIARQVPVALQLRL